MVLYFLKLETNGASEQFNVEGSTVLARPNQYLWSTLLRMSWEELPTKYSLIIWHWWTRSFIFPHLSCSKPSLHCNRYRYRPLSYSLLGVGDCACRLSAEWWWQQKGRKEEIKWFYVLARKEQENYLTILENPFQCFIQMLFITITVTCDIVSDLIKKS